MSAAHPNPQSVLADIVRVLDGRRAARQDKIALAVGRRTSDNTLGLALAYGARAGVPRFDCPICPGRARQSRSRSTTTDHRVTERPDTRRERDAVAPLRRISVLRWLTTRLDERHPAHRGRPGLTPRLPESHDRERQSRIHSLPQERSHGRARLRDPLARRWPRRVEETQ
jgi:hypothetical protein